MEAPAWATDKIDFGDTVVFYNKERWKWVCTDEDDEGKWGVDDNDTLDEYLDRRIVKEAKHSQLNVEIVNE